MYSFIWGTASLSARVLGDAAPLGGGVTFGFGAQDWRHNLGSLPYPQSTGRSLKKAVFRKMDDVMDAQVMRGRNENECCVGMACREDPRRCRWLASGQMKTLVGSQDRGRSPAQTARGSWPSGGGSAGNKWTCSTQSDQAVRAIGGIVGCGTITPTDPVV